LHTVSTILAEGAFGADLTINIAQNGLHFPDGVEIAAHSMPLRASRIDRFASAPDSSGQASPTRYLPKIFEGLVRKLVVR